MSDSAVDLLPEGGSVMVGRMKFTFSTLAHGTADPDYGFAEEMEEQAAGADTMVTTPTIAELKRSLFLQPPHSCHDDAILYLCPPTQGTGEYVRVRPDPRPIPLLAKYLEIDARDEWTFDLGDGGYAPVIEFCPFCGKKLPPSNISGCGNQMLALGYPGIPAGDVQAAIDRLRGAQE